MYGRVFMSMAAVLAWSLAGGAILVMFTGAVWFVLSPLVGVTAPVVVLFGMLMAARLVIRARQRRGFTVIGYLEQSARLNLPLPEMLRAAEFSERGGTAGRLNDLRIALNSGMTLGRALELYVPEVGWREQREIVVGERMGRLGATLTRVHARTLNRLRGEHGGTSDPMLGWSYAAVISAILLALLGGITLLILPKFVEIFADFDTTMPWMTQVTFDIGSRLSWVLLPIAVGAVMLLAGWSLWSLGNIARGEWMRLRPVEGTLRRLPVVGGMLRDRAWAAAHASTRDALTAGYAMPEALRLAGDSAVTRAVRARLLRTADALEGGGGLAAATAAAGWPALERGLLAAVDHGGDAPQTFGFLSRYRAGRFSRLAALLQAAVLPVVVILLALAVGWFVYSLFLPLVELVYSVVPDCGAL